MTEMINKPRYLSNFLGSSTDTEEIITSDSHSFFSHLVVAQSAVSAFCFRHDPLVYDEISTAFLISITCFTTNYDVVINASELLTALKKYRQPSSVHIGFRYIPEVNHRNKIFDEKNPYQQLFISFYSHAFVAYYESIIDNIKQIFGNNKRLWPETLRFADCVRNAFAHGGAIHINDKNKPEFQWRDLKYSFSDNGKRILYQDISNGDLIVLMFEIDLLLKS